MKAALSWLSDSVPREATHMVNWQYCVVEVLISSVYERGRRDAKPEITDSLTTQQLMCRARAAATHPGHVRAGW